MPWVLRAAGNSSPKYFSEWFGFSLVAVLVAGPLAMVATVFLVTSYPTPVDDEISLGLAGFLFVLLLDVFLVSRLAVSKVRQGQRMAAVKGSVGLILLGLLAASVVG